MAACLAFRTCMIKSCSYPTAILRVLFFFVAAEAQFTEQVGLKAVKFREGIGQQLNSPGPLGAQQVNALYSPFDVEIVILLGRHPEGSFQNVQLTVKGQQTGQLSSRLLAWNSV